MNDEKFIEFIDRIGVRSWFKKTIDAIYNYINSSINNLNIIISNHISTINNNFVSYNSQNITYNKKMIAAKNIGINYLYLDYSDENDNVLTQDLHNKIMESYFIMFNNNNVIYVRETGFINTNNLAFYSKYRYSDNLFYEISYNPDTKTLSKKTGRKYLNVATSLGTNNNIAASQNLINTVNNNINNKFSNYVSYNASDNKTAEVKMLALDNLGIKQVIMSLDIMNNNYTLTDNYANRVASASILLFTNNNWNTIFIKEYQDYGNIMYFYRKAYDDNIFIRIKFDKSTKILHKAEKIKFITPKNYLNSNSPNDFFSAEAGYNLYLDKVSYNKNDNKTDAEKVIARENLNLFVCHFTHNITTSLTITDATIKNRILKAQYITFSKHPDLILYRIYPDSDTLIYFQNKNVYTNTFNQITYNKQSGVLSALSTGKIVGLGTYDSGNTNEALTRAAGTELHRRLREIEKITPLLVNAENYTANDITNLCNNVKNNLIRPVTIYHKGIKHKIAFTSNSATVYNLYSYIKRINNTNACNFVYVYFEINETAKTIIYKELPYFNILKTIDDIINSDSNSFDVMSTTAFVEYIYAHMEDYNTLDGRIANLEERKGLIKLMNSKLNTTLNDVDAADILHCSTVEIITSLIDIALNKYNVFTRVNTFNNIITFQNSYYTNGPDAVSIQVNTITYNSSTKLLSNITSNSYSLRKI